MSAPARRVATFLMVPAGLALAAWTFAPAAAARAADDNKTVFAAVADAQGKPCTSLTKADWLVREDGKDRTVVDAKPATEPLEIVFVVDGTRYIQSYLTDIRGAITQFGDAVLKANPTAQIAVQQFGEQSTPLTKFSSSPDDLAKAAGHLIPDQGQGGVLLEALVDAAKMLEKTPSPRRAIVSVSLGNAPDSDQQPPASIAQEVLKSGATYWAVEFRNTGGAAVGTTGAGPGSSDMSGMAVSAPTRDMILQNLPAQTGGAFQPVTASDAIAVRLAQMAAILSAQYEVTYTRPPGPKPGRLQMGAICNGTPIAALAPYNAPK